MRLFSIINFKQDVTAFIKDWTKMLSCGNFQEACALLDVPDNENYYIRWNKEKLKRIFTEYGHGHMPIINNPYFMNTYKDNIDFYEYNDKTGVAVEYDFPLNGEWGDLTAKFSFIKYTENLYFVYLTDIRVL